MRSRVFLICVSLLLALPLLVLLATGYGETGQQGIFSAAHVVLAELNLTAPHADHFVLKLRLLRALCAIGVGGSLALAGAMMQGLFRNPMAEPGLLGISSGASLGAITGIALLGGYGAEIWSNAGGGSLTLAVVPMLAFAGALTAALAIYKLSTRAGKISVPSLLLMGLAMNALLGALIAAMQAVMLENWQVARAIVAWGFGSLDDRGTGHVIVVACGSILALASIPYVGLELDLLAGGEEDAASLGANPARVKTIVLACAALATAAAISVSGQIAFVGLLVPHLARPFVGVHHRAVLPTSFLLGAVLLLSIVVIQSGLCPMLANVIDPRHEATGARALLRISQLQPGVLTSLLGAPFFLFLLLRQERMNAL